VEGQFEDVDEKVDGVAGQIARGPTPVGFLGDQTGKGGQLEVARLRFDELQAAFAVAG